MKNILVSQPKPQTEKSPYFQLAEKWGINIDFKPFIQVQSITAKEFRKTKMNILDYTAVIFTSRTSVDHYFRIAKELRIAIPDSMKYFCISEATAYYLQKYIVYRKRKIFYGKQKFSDLVEIIQRNQDNYFLLPCSDIHKQEYSQLLEKNNIKYQKCVLYRTVASDLSDIAEFNYDILVFFSPSGIKSLLKNFPEFKQNNIKIAAFGPTTANAVIEAGLKLDIKAPTPKAPSMTMAIDQYLKKHHK